MPGTLLKSLMRGSKWVRRSIYSLARFLSQHGFSCAAVQEEQLRLSVFSKLSSCILTPSDDIIRALASAWWYTAFICQWNFGGLSFPSVKIQGPNSNGYPTYFSGSPFLLTVHWLCTAFKRHPWLPRFHALHRNTEILYDATTLRTQKPLLILTQSGLANIWLVQSHWKVSGYLIPTDQWFTLEMPQSTWPTH